MKEKIKIRLATFLDILKLDEIRVEDRKDFDSPLFVHGDIPVYSTWRGLKPVIKFFFYLLHPKRQIIFIGTWGHMGVCVLNDKLIEGFYIGEYYRKRGLGSKLMKYVLENFEVESVGVQAHNIRAKKFYKKFGFKEKEIILGLKK